MAPVTQQDAAAMDDMAAWASSNVLPIKPATAEDATARQCYTALQQSLAHYRNAGRLTAAQQRHDHTLLRAHFLRAEAEVLLDEQWAEYEADADGPIDRADTFHRNGCLYAWSVWDKRMHDLYHSLLERAEAAEAEAKYGSAKL